MYEIVLCRRVETQEETDRLFGNRYESILTIRDER